MKNKFLFIFSFIILTLIILNGFQKELSFKDRRELILEDITLAIEGAEKEGRYKCCIEPACTMCYLGDWIWGDGSCYCDDMIKQGEDDKVCPQCKKGLEEGLCKSVEEEECEIKNGENFKSAY